MAESTTTGRAAVAAKKGDPKNLHRESPLILDSTQDVGLSFESPESSLVARARYDDQTEMLTVDLKVPTPQDKERTQAYEVSCFPAALWREFAQAPSKGQFFNRNIRPIFPSRKKP